MAGRSAVLVAGVGNELCRDDGFGIAVARSFAESGPPDRVQVYEAGIAGVALVQELMQGFDALVIVDAIDRGGEPGRLYLLESDVQDICTLGDTERWEFLADTHYTVPSKVLSLSQALGVLPDQVYILGCQPESCELGLGLTRPVAAAVEDAVRQLHQLTTTLVAGESYVPGYSA